MNGNRIHSCDADSNYRRGPALVFRGQWMGGGKHVAIISLEELGADFFRPESLRLDARPYVYDSLMDVKKVGSNWILDIKGADEPNRAEAVLDSDFKLVKVTKR